MHDALFRRGLERVVACTQPFEGRDGRVAFADCGLAEEFEAVFCGYVLVTGVGGLRGVLMKIGEGGRREG